MEPLMAMEWFGGTGLSLILLTTVVLILLKLYHLILW